MTRVTNFGRKRTYLQAGFDHTDALENAVEEPVKATPDDTNVLATKKPRKRQRKSKAAGGAHAEEGATQAEERQSGSQPKAEQATRKKGKTGIKRQQESKKHDGGELQHLVIS
jgi:zinc finger CCHC domain-containing protein 9